MRRVVIRIALLLGVMVVVTGCPEVPESPSYVCVDKFVTKIAPEGGRDTVRMCPSEPYDYWRLSKVDSDGEDWEIRIYDPSLTDEYFELLPRIRWTDTMQMENNWYRVYIPRTDLRSFVVECKPNDSEVRRELCINLMTEDGEMAWFYVEQDKMVRCEEVNNAE
ncbi:MAG: hypothetical protein II951_02155 [Bacteroidales bacterium]|nr:hypothetical protein [Bacteroidales bacterium]